MDNLQLAEIQEVEGVEKERFKIEDKQQAQWALRKISALKAQIDENKALAEKEIQRVKEWEESENKAAQDSIEFFTALLQEYMLKERESDSKLKSIKLPHGTIRFRKQQPEWRIDDESAIKFLEENYPEKVQVVKKYSKNDIKKIYKETGEVFDGLEIVEREDKFEVITE